MGKWVDLLEVPLEPLSEELRRAQGGTAVDQSNFENDFAEVTKQMGVATEKISLPGKKRNDDQNKTHAQHT